LAVSESEKRGIRNTSEMVMLMLMRMLRMMRMMRMMIIIMMMMLMLINPHFVWFTLSRETLVHKPEADPV